MEQGTRPPAVAGSFYPAGAEALRAALRACREHPLAVAGGPEERAEPPCALVVPHAGYAYSGPIAARCYALLPDPPPAAIALVGPDHRGWGAPVSLSSASAWQTPLGTAPTERRLTEALLAHCPCASYHDGAHGVEHALEVQVPFIQERYGDQVPLLPVLIADQAWATCQTLGSALAAVIADRAILLVASSDWTHYAPRAVAEEQDRRAMRPLLDLDPAAFHGAIVRGRVSSCGFGAVAAVLHAAKLLGARRAVLLGYATSADTGGQPESVVGYAAIAVYKD